MSQTSHPERQEMKHLLGFDIGGTKCAVIVGRAEGQDVQLLRRIAFPTPLGPEAALSKLEVTARELLGDLKPHAVGISCGGPLDSRRGVVMGPPNLPGWDNVPITERVNTAFGVQAFLQNDANACAFAEWKWGAGRGVDSMVFLTFGTGMGAGLILDRHLYSGKNDLAGEVGHVRLAENGPLGYGKRGSFEGFCSGGGIVRAAQEQGLDISDARQVFEAANAGNPSARQVVESSARQLGRGLALIIDILNPERIVIGSIFARQRDQLWPIAQSVLREEALAAGVSVCSVVPAGLGEKIGDYAALSVATLGQ
jgi:glucokinase